MSFKAQSASVYGIDAYLVEVEGVKVARTIADLDGGSNIEPRPLERAHPVSNAGSVLLGLRRDSASIAIGMRDS